MRTHIIISDELVGEVDKLVGQRKRSAFFEEVISKEIKKIKLLKAAEKAGGSLANVDIPGWESSESAAKWVHDQRRIKRSSE